MIVSEFWEFLAFFVNSIVFLLIGDQINFGSLGTHLGLIGTAIAAVLVARLLIVFGLGSLSNWLGNQDLKARELTVLWWGGLRGGVSIALALSVPVVLEGRQEIIDAVFGVVLFTLLVQGLTMQVVLEKLDLIGDQPQRQQYSEALARRTALNRVLHYLDDWEPSPEIDPEFYRYQQSLVKQELTSVEEQLADLQRTYPQLRALNL